jgi:hypothetical protein
MVSSTIFFVILSGRSVKLEVVQARRRRCQFGTDSFDLEGDPVGRSRPGSTQGAT